MTYFWTFPVMVIGNSVMTRSIGNQKLADCLQNPWVYASRGTGYCGPQSRSECKAQYFSQDARVTNQRYVRYVFNLECYKAA